jgi:hypothetical protein
VSFNSSIEGNFGLRYRKRQDVIKRKPPTPVVNNIKQARKT